MVEYVVVLVELVVVYVEFVFQCEYCFQFVVQIFVVFQVLLVVLCIFVCELVICFFDFIDVDVVCVIEVFVDQVVQCYVGFGKGWCGEGSECGGKNDVFFYDGFLELRVGQVECLVNVGLLYVWFVGWMMWCVVV